VCTSLFCPFLLLQSIVKILLLSILNVFFFRDRDELLPQFLCPSLSFLLQLLYCLRDITNCETKKGKERISFFPSEHPCFRLFVSFNCESKRPNWERILTRDRQEKGIDEMSHNWRRRGNSKSPWRVKWSSHVKKREPVPRECLSLFLFYLEWVDFSCLPVNWRHRLRQGDGMSDHLLSLSGRTFPWDGRRRAGHLRMTGKRQK